MATTQSPRQQLILLANDLADVRQRALRTATRRYNLVSQTSLVALQYARDGVMREGMAQPADAIQTDALTQLTERRSQRTWRAGDLFDYEPTATITLMGPDNDDDGDADIATLAQLEHDAAACGLKARDLVSARVLTDGTNSQVQYAARSLAQDLEACIASNNRAE